MVLTTPLEKNSQGSKLVRFAETKAMEYQANDPPSLPLTPVLDAASRYPIAEQETKQEEQVFLSMTKENTAILREWEDCQVFEDTEEETLAPPPSQRRRSIYFSPPRYVDENEDWNILSALSVHSPPVAETLRIANHHTDLCGRDNNKVSVVIYIPCIVSECC